MQTQRLSINKNKSKPSAIASGLLSSESDSDDYSSASRSKQRSVSVNAVVTSDHSPPDIDMSIYKLIHPSAYSSITKNAKMTYIKNNDKRINNKYFKSYDSVDDTIVIGFYTNDKRNYTEKIKNIKQLYTTNVTGGSVDIDVLKNAIEIPLNKIKSLNRDTVVSYEKQDKTWVHSVKFNAFVKSKTDQSTRMSLTNETGFTYTISPTKITKLYRHFSNQDKTMSMILQQLKKMELQFNDLTKRISDLERVVGTKNHK